MFFPTSGTRQKCLLSAPPHTFFFRLALPTNSISRAGFHGQFYRRPPWKKPSSILHKRSCLLFLPAWNHIMTFIQAADGHEWGRRGFVCTSERRLGELFGVNVADFQEEKKKRVSDNSFIVEEETLCVGEKKVCCTRVKSWLHFQEKKVHFKHDGLLSSQNLLYIFEKKSCDLIQNSWKYTIISEKYLLFFGVHFREISHFFFLSAN